MLDGPLFVDQPYDIVHTVVALEREPPDRVLLDPKVDLPRGGGSQDGHVMLHSGVFKDSFPGYPQGESAVGRQGLRSTTRAIQQHCPIARRPGRSSAIAGCC